MIHIQPKDISVPEVQRLMQGGIGPRPIALVSTISKEGLHNLSPFSFFNAFGANPPIVAFSPSRRGKDATFKDTYNNLISNGECVIQCVTYSMVEQISLASTEYAPDVDEFIKSGLTPIDSDLVKPKRVKESPFQMECILKEMKSYGTGGSSANIAICEVLKFHVAEDLFENGIILPEKIDLVGRMSADFYCRASGNSIFVVQKPVSKKGIGFDSLPIFIKESKIYTANNLGKLANVESIPSDEEVEKFYKEKFEADTRNFESGKETFNRYERLKDYEKMLKAALLLDPRDPAKKDFIELSAKCALEENNVSFAWLAALLVNLLKLI
jgi:flavin reductase (DIM6/NTAB) family NADH-FMN oxidoreductase RutF